LIKNKMKETMKEELKRINRRLEKARRRLKNPKYFDNESELIDRLVLRKLEIQAEQER
jgi:hypothetical protein